VGQRGTLEVWWGHKSWNFGTEKVPKSKQTIRAFLIHQVWRTSNFVTRDLLSY